MRRVVQAIAFGFIGLSGTAVMAQNAAPAPAGNVMLQSSNTTFQLDLHVNDGIGEIVAHRMGIERRHARGRRDADARLI